MLIEGNMYYVFLQKVICKLTNGRLEVIIIHTKDIISTNCLQILFWSCLWLESYNRSCYLSRYTTCNTVQWGQRKYKFCNIVTNTIIYTYLTLTKPEYVIIVARVITTRNSSLNTQYSHIFVTTITTTITVFMRTHL